MANKGKREALKKAYQKRATEIYKMKDEKAMNAALDEVRAETMKKMRQAK